MVKSKFVLIPVALLMASCGNVSEIKSQNSKANKVVDLSQYQNSTITVTKFTKNEDKYKCLNDIPSVLSSNLLNAINNHGMNAVYNSDGETSDGLVLKGNVLKCKEGNAFARAMIGFGAGRSHIHANIDLVDAKTKNTVGTIEVRKASYLLGGAIAQGQTVEVLSKDASSSVVEKLKKAINTKK